jgi:hypothetical protein
MVEAKTSTGERVWCFFRKNIDIPENKSIIIQAYSFGSHKQHISDTFSDKR